MLCDNLDYGLTVIPLKQCKCHSHNSVGRKVERLREDRGGGRKEGESEGGGREGGERGDCCSCTTETV